MTNVVAAAPSFRFSSTTSLFDAIGSEGLPQSRFRENGMFFINDKPVVVRFIRNENQALQGACLVRPDWKDMSPFMQCLTSLFSALGLVQGREERASAEQFAKVKDRIIPESNLDKMAPEDRIAIIAQEMPVADVLVQKGKGSQTSVQAWIDENNEVLTKYAASSEYDSIRTGMANLQNRVRTDAPDGAKPITPGTGMAKNMPPFGLLHFNFDEIPARSRALPKFNEVALGDMHGNCLLLLHSLVQLGLFKIVDEQAWRAACQLLDEMEGVRGIKATDKHTDYNAFGNFLRKAMSYAYASDARPPNLVLLGDLLGDRMHDDRCMLKIFEMMHHASLPFDIMYSNHDQHLLQFYCRLRDGTAGKMKPSMDTTSLTRASGAALADANVAKDLVRMVEASYLPHLRLISLNGNGEKAYTHGVANRASIGELMESIGLSKDSALTRPVCDDINRDFIRSILEDNGQRYLDKTVLERCPKTSGITAVSHNIGPGRNNFHDSESRPVIDISLPTGLVGIIHGHCRDVSTRIATDYPTYQSIIDHLATLQKRAGIRAREPASLSAIVGIFGQNTCWNIPRSAGAIVIALLLRDADAANRAKSAAETLANAPGQLIAQLLRVAAVEPSDKQLAELGDNLKTALDAMLRTARLRSRMPKLYPNVVLAIASYLAKLSNIDDKAYEAYEASTLKNCLDAGSSAMEDNRAYFQNCALKNGFLDTNGNGDVLALIKEIGRCYDTLDGNAGQLARQRMFERRFAMC